MLCSFSTDLIIAEDKCDECLKKIVSEWMNKKKIGVDCITLFCCSALARRCSSAAPIRLEYNANEVKVCVN